MLNATERKVIAFSIVAMIVMIFAKAIIGEPLAWPLRDTGGKQWLSSSYGLRAAPLGGVTGSFHAGIDLACRIGTPVLAVGDGVVMVCAIGDPIFGRYIVLRLDSGIDVIYGHLSETWTPKGARVARGQVLGLSGNSGASTGPHLHLGIMADPLSLFVINSIQARKE